MQKHFLRRIIETQTKSQEPKRSLMKVRRCWNAAENLNLLSTYVALNSKLFEPRYFTPAALFTANTACMNIFALDSKVAVFSKLIVLSADL